MENWQIKYDMQTPNGIVHMNEELLCKDGYHQKLTEWYNQNDLDLNKMCPLYKVRGNDIELLCPFGFGGGSKNLPLESRAELKNCKLLSSKNHPIMLIAPNGTGYIRTKF